MKYLLGVLLMFIYPLTLTGQNGEETVRTLINMGFENVRWTENQDERTYVVENTAYRLNGIGISKAIDQIQKTGMPQNKACRLIVTDNNIPQISLYCSTSSDSVSQKKVERNDWKVSYELGNSWNEVKKEKKRNSSLYKIDLVVYPEFSFKNVVITQLYQSVLNLSPALEVSLWEGMKFAGQVVFPIYNDGYKDEWSKIRPGFISLSQSLRLPGNIFTTASIGLFSNERYGVDLKADYPLLFLDEHMSIEGRISYTGTGYWNGFKYVYGTKKRAFWHIGGNYYWARFNTQFSLKAEQYLAGERGIKGEMIRHFRHTSIGFYIAKAEGAEEYYGFRVQVALPPYKYKRNKYIPRVLPSKNMGINYIASNEARYYQTFRTHSGDNIMQQNSFNPYYIKSELINF